MNANIQNQAHWSSEANFLISNQHSWELPTQQVAKFCFITLAVPLLLKFKLQAEISRSHSRVHLSRKSFGEDCGKENKTKQHIFFDCCWKCECNEMIVFIIWQESSPRWLAEPWEKRFFSRLGNKTNAVRLPNLHFLLAYIFHNKLREEWLERSGKSSDLLTAIARRCFSQPVVGGIYSQILFESTEIIVKVNE